MEIEDLQEKQRLLSTASSGPATLAVDPAAATHDAHGETLKLFIFPFWLKVTHQNGKNLLLTQMWDVRSFSLGSCR